VSKMKRYMELQQAMTHRASEKLMARATAGGIEFSHCVQGSETRIVLLSPDEALRLAAWIRETLEEEV
jgi:hypothetical protein